MTECDCMISGLPFKMKTIVNGDGDSGSPGH